MLEAEVADAGVFAPVDDLAREDVVADMVRAAYGGDPSNNDAMLRATLGVSSAEEVDEAGTGWLFFLPLVPFDGSAVAHALRMLTTIGDECGVAPGATVNALDADLLDLVVSLKFHPDDAAKAHRALDRLHEEFVDVGYLPYRADIDHGAWTEHRGPDLSARELTRRVKRVLDPRGVIAPGRYA